ncbi:MAG: Flp pilus assembly protein CpaB [Alphaproteobacteria bacterium]|nr:Flp pilus assembly protein CpaB [Alphaproteobacteria bacterium]
MTNRRTLFLALAIIMGLGTMMMMRSAMSNKTVAVNNTNQILVAAADVPAGQFVQPQHVRWQAWAPEHTTQAFIKNAPSEKLDSYIGAVVRQGIRAGEPILKGQLVKPQERGFLAAVLDGGKRAIAVPITNVTGIAGFVFPGDRIDLILTHSIRSQDDDKIPQRRASVTVVKDVRVLALDQDANDQGEAKAKVAKVATLEVTPKQAEVLTLALQLGTISLSLRSIAQETSPDGKPLAEPVAFEKDALTLDSEVSQIIPRPDDHSQVSGQIVQVLRGSKARTEENFDDSKKN